MPTIDFSCLGIIPVTPCDCILHSPTDPHGVHLQSTCSPWSPPGLHMSPPSVHLLSFSSVLHSTPLLMESSWSPHGVDCNRILDLVKSMKSIGGLLVESQWTPGGIHKDCMEMLNKMHPQGIEHTISCIDVYISNSIPLTTRP